MIKLYSNHCPCCEVLSKELRSAGIPFTAFTDTDQMLSMGFTHLPMLDVDGQLLNYPDALKWIKERKNSHENR